MDDLKKLLENAGMLSAEMAEANPDGTISGDEDEAREELMAFFEAELDDLLSKAGSAAQEIGGEYRAPGIKHAMKKLAEAKLYEFTKGKIEWLKKVDDEDHGYDRDYPMADPTGTMKAPIDDYTKR